VVIYREPGKFGGWPANHGIWNWGDEIIVGFEIGYYKPELATHSIDLTKPSESVIARSLDGGQTWKIEQHKNFIWGMGMGLACQKVQQHFKDGVKVIPNTGNINFIHPDFAFTCRMTSFYGGYSNFYFSYDRGRTWKGPFELPTFGQIFHAGRTDYITIGRDECLIFITASKKNGKEGRPFCAKTIDGGKTWKFLSWITPEQPEGALTIMPSTVQTSDKQLICAVRLHNKVNKEGSITVYQSNDNGKSWQFLAEAAKTGKGNPPSLTKLKDGRICLTYGYRKSPYGIRAKISEDNGKSWGKEIILRQDGRSWDLGYPRTVQRADGKMVTVYYYTDNNHPEQYIAATIWDAGSAD
ncbi:MAG: sialidase family protein, partial [Planctomycetota bacterium]